MGTVPHAAHDAGDPLVKELQSLVERVHSATCPITGAIAIERADWRGRRR
jgi:hypothetical protein